MRWAAVLGGRRRPVSRVLCPQYADGDHLSSPRRRAVAGGRFRPTGTALPPGSAGTALPPGSSGQPGDEPGAPSPSIWPCSRWGLAAAASPPPPGALAARFHPYPPPPAARRWRAVCFCATFRPRRRCCRRRVLGVTQHPARRSPDFPPRACQQTRGGHPSGAALYRQSSTAIMPGATKPRPPSANPGNRTDLKRPKPHIPDANLCNRTDPKRPKPHIKPPPPPTQAQPQNTPNPTPNHRRKPRKSPPFAKGGLGGFRGVVGG